MAAVKREFIKDMKPQPNQLSSTSQAPPLMEDNNI
jgi:hypothetical protein